LPAAQVALAAISVAICYADRSNISTAILPMSQQFGWEQSWQGLILSMFFLGYLATQLLGGEALPWALLAVRRGCCPGGPLEGCWYGRTVEGLLLWRIFGGWLKMGVAGLGGNIASGCPGAGCRLPSRLLLLAVACLAACCCWLSLT
jgi:hypothetical protein